LWNEVKPLVRKYESEDACLIFDDTIIRESLKTPKSRLATESKAEFTKVNEHFANRA
jgi:hypothetical protein